MSLTTTPVCGTLGCHADATATIRLDDGREVTACEECAAGEDVVERVE